MQYVPSFDQTDIGREFKSGLQSFPYQKLFVFSFTCCRCGITFLPASALSINGQLSCSWLFGFPCLSGKEPQNRSVRLLPQKPWAFLSSVQFVSTAITVWLCGSQTWSSTSRNRNTIQRQRLSLKKEWSMSRLTSPWKTKCIAKDTTSMTSKSLLSFSILFWAVVREKDKTRMSPVYQVPQPEDEVDGVWGLRVWGVLLWRHHLHTHLLQKLHLHCELVL